MRKMSRLDFVKSWGLRESEKSILDGIRDILVLLYGILDPSLTRRNSEYPESPYLTQKSVILLEHSTSHFIQVRFDQVVHSFLMVFTLVPSFIRT